MLIPVITFQIPNSITNEPVHFCVENTETNYERILSHHYTRQIQFSEMFSFQFDKEMAMPVEFIEMNTWMRLVSQTPELLVEFGAAYYDANGVITEYSELVNEMCDKALDAPVAA